jgi:hypothetical protein
MATTTFALTAGGTRQFGNNFLIRWTPSQVLAQLTVQVFAGGSLLANNVFTPDNATQPVHGSSGTFEVTGMITAMFDAAGTSGTLVALQLNMIANGVDQGFKGTIGMW